MLPPPIVFTWRRDEDPAYLRDREWLVTNGLGGYASGTLLGIGTRRYHGLFVPNLVEPKGRHIMISRFDEEVECGDRMVRLGGAEFLDGRLETDVPRFLEEFRVDALMPALVHNAGVQAQGPLSVVVNARGLLPLHALALPLLVAAVVALWPRFAR